MQLALSTYQNRGNFYLSSKKSVSNTCSSLELSNHLGNVLSVISDKVIPHASGGSVAYYKADIMQAMDYSPFGVTLKGRNLKKTGLADEFRFGYQGSEQDDEMKGDGNSYTTEFRQLDTRLGRWFSIDPKMSAWEGPYSSMGNNPIKFNDPLGDTINLGKEFTGNGSYAAAWKLFSESDAGKELIKKYSPGGEFGHLNVNLEVGDISTRGQAETFLTVDGVKSEISGGNKNVLNSKDLVNGKSSAVLSFTITLPKTYPEYHTNNPGSAAAAAARLGSIDQILSNVKGGHSILHEFQHVELAIMGLLSSNNGKVPSNTDQHAIMDNPNKHFYQDRVKYWWGHTPVWYNEFLEMKKQSIKDKKLTDPHATKLKIFKGIDYINNQDVGL